MKNTLFLDIDGVLHPMSATCIDFVDGRMEVTGEELFRWAPLLWELIEPYPVTIAIHGSWRHCYRLDEVLRNFPEAMQARVAGMTAGAGRYESIQLWLEHYPVTRFAVLDDMPAAFPTNWPHLIVCHPERGIADQTVQERLRKFLSYCT